MYKAAIAAGFITADQNNLPDQFSKLCVIYGPSKLSTFKGAIEFNVPLSQSSSSLAWI